MSDHPVEPKVGEDRKEDNGEVVVPDHSLDEAADAVTDDEGPSMEPGDQA